MGILLKTTSLLSLLKARANSGKPKRKYVWTQNKKKYLSARNATFISK
jgi:hypothetical protein